MSKLHATLEAVTARIIERSKPGRVGLSRPDCAPTRCRCQPDGTLSCGNLAHGFAASGDDKAAIRGGKAMNIGIVSAYNDMLSAHQPYGRYPEQMKLFAREVGATAQVAGATFQRCATV